MAESNKNILYLGVEFTADDVLRSKLLTDDPFVALADMMLKARKPFGTKPNRTKKFMFSSARIYLGGLKMGDKQTGNPNILNIVMETEDISSKEQISRYCIETRKTDREFLDKHLDATTKIQEKQNMHLHFGNGTSTFYKSQSYEMSLRELAHRLKYHTDEDIALAKLLTVSASRSPEHIIWDKDKPGEKFRKTSYQTRWNATSWSGWF